MYVLNTEYFGHLLRPNTYSSLQEAANAFLNFKLQTLGRHSKVRSYLPVSLPVLHLSCVCCWVSDMDSTAGDGLRWRTGGGGEGGRRWVPSIIVIFPHVLSLMCEAQELLSMFISSWLLMSSRLWCMNPKAASHCLQSGNVEVTKTWVEVTSFPASIPCEGSMGMRLD